MSKLFIKGLTLIFFVAMISCFVNYKSQEATSPTLSIVQQDSLKTAAHKEKFVRAYLKEGGMIVDDPHSSENPFYTIGPFMSARKDSIFMQSSKSGNIISSRKMLSSDIDLIYKNIMNKLSKNKISSVVYLDADKKEVHGYSGPLFFGSKQYSFPGEFEKEERSKFIATKSFDTLTQTWKYEITDTLGGR